MELRQFKGVSDATDELIDFSEAVKLSGLTYNQLNSLQMYFIADCEQYEIADSMGRSQPNISRDINVSIRKIARVYDYWDELEEMYIHMEESK